MLDAVAEVVASGVSPVGVVESARVAKAHGPRGEVVAAGAGVTLMAAA